MPYRAMRKPRKFGATRTHGLQDPADRAVAAATNHLEILHVLEHLQALHGPAGRQIMDLPGIQDILKFP